MASSDDGGGGDQRVWVRKNVVGSEMLWWRVRECGGGRDRVGGWGGEVGCFVRGMDVCSRVYEQECSSREWPSLVHVDCAPHKRRGIGVCTTTSREYGAVHVTCGSRAPQLHGMNPWPVRSAYV